MITALTDGPLHHFFGYYGICPWDSTGRYHLALQTPFHDRAPTASDTATVGLVDVAENEFKPFAQTKAFNLQQGSMMHWINAGSGEEFTFNDWNGEQLVSRAVDVRTGKQRTLGAAIAAVSPTAPLAIGINFARTYACRHVTGYANAFYSGKTIEMAPATDGLQRIDLRTGRAELFVSLGDIETTLPCRNAPSQLRWIEHVVFNTDGTRLLFLCRITQTGKRFLDSLWTVNLDGRHLRCLIEYGHVISHFAWDSPDTVMLSCDVAGQMQFVMLDMNRETVEPMPIEGFPPDGHNAFSPDHQWIACDTYPRDPDRVCSLLLHDRRRRRTHTIGLFPHPKHIRGDWRCDLHPRWSKDGTRISFDSVHKGDRQIYEADVSGIVHENHGAQHTDAGDGK